MQSLNMLETPVDPNLPKCENDSVGSISRDVADLAWLAGVIDGEGYLGINWGTKHTAVRDGSSRRQAVVRCHIRNTDPFMIQRISEIYYRHNLNFFWKWCKVYKDNKKWRESVEIVIISIGALEKLLKMITPFLVTKKDQAELILQYFKWRSSGVVPTRHPSPGQSEILLQKQNELDLALRKAKRIRYGFQRLPKAASRPLDLTNLEVMV